jgi:nitrate/nitrite transport system ATP-binding protein
MLLEIKGVHKGYGGRPVLRDINLQVEEGEFLAIVGQSGSGKTTLISLIAGLAMPDSGEITLRGQPIRGPGPDRGVIFQTYSLLPWRTVAGNIRLAVDHVFGDWSGEQREQHVLKHIEMVVLGHAADKRPSELSGGMKQRVAVARGLATSPDILLLDEPFSALDALTRANLQDQLLHICEQSRKTVILITNDIDEALLLADRIVPIVAGDGSTLGPSVPVDVPHPRDRRTLNHDERFKRVRLRAIEGLVGQGAHWTVETEAPPPPVELQPVDLRNAGMLYRIFGILPRGAR